MRKNEDLGSWDKFVATLTEIYGQRDKVKSAKAELEELFDNRQLASSDFIRYAEQFRTLAEIANFDEPMLCKKLTKVISKEHKSAMAPLCLLTGQEPKKWREYLSTLLEVWKIQHEDKAATDRLFGNKEKGDAKGKGKDESGKKDSGKGKETNAVQADKKKKYCQLCHDAGLTNREKTHNTRDCYSKPENKDKAPKPRSTGTASTQGGGSFSGSKGKANGNAPGKGKYSSKELRNQLIKLLRTVSNNNKAAGSFLIKFCLSQSILQSMP